MEQLKNRLVSRLQNTKFLKELREFDSLIKAIGECKSKSEEDRIILAETETLKARLADPKIDKARGREYMVRLIYCEMLGHDVSWAYIKALQFASEPNILTKKAAYLALTQFFDHNHELVLLLVNTLLSDLKSDNFINVCTGLVVCTKLIGPDLINAVYPVVVDLLKHPKDHVRKKAIMVLHRFQQLDPKREGPLSGLDLDRHFRTMLCDKDPGVMSATLCALYDVIKANPTPYKNLVPSFTSILKQVSEHRLPKSYDYHRVPAPFVQIKLLKILALLGAGDRASSENMYAVVQLVLRRAAGTHTIGNALIAECVATITTIFPNPHLLTAAAEAVASFLRSPVHNLRYVGVNALGGIIRINPQAAQDHQLAVVDCLEDPDDTLKLKTLELLYRMTKAANVDVIVERMLSYLRTVTDDHIKRDITRKVSELAERYAPSPSWFIRVVSEVCELAGDHMEPAMAHSLTRLISEQDAALHRSAVEQYAKLLDAPVNRKLPDMLLQVIVWTLGEYGNLLASSSHSLTVHQVQAKLVGLLSRQKCSDSVRLLLPPALAKLSVQGGVPLAAEASAWLTRAGSSQSVELQQRSYEAQALLTAPQAVQVGALPHDASCEEVDEAELDALRRLAFLDWYVDKALESGAAPYAPDRHRSALGLGVVDATHQRGPSEGHGLGLRFEAYNVATPPAAATPSATGGGVLDNFFGGNSAAPHPPAPAAAAPAAPPPAPPAGPQLLAALNKGPGRWGPAKFEPPPSAAKPAAAAVVATPSPAAPPGPGSGGLLGDLSGGGRGSSGGRGTPKSGGKPSERDRLAASLFAGVGTSAGSGGGSGSGVGHHPAKRAATPPPPPPAPAVDLLSLDDPDPAPAPAPAPAATAPRPVAPSSGFDMLMDFDATPPAAPAASAAPKPAPGLGGLDSLLGDLSGPSPQLGAASGGSGGNGLFGSPALVPSGGLADFGGLLGGSVPPASAGLLGGVHRGVGGASLATASGLGVTSAAAFQGLNNTQLTSMVGPGIGTRPGLQPAVASQHLLPAAPPVKPPAKSDPFADLI